MYICTVCKKSTELRQPMLRLIEKGPKLDPKTERTNIQIVREIPVCERCYTKHKVETTFPF